MKSFVLDRSKFSGDRSVESLVSLFICELCPALDGLMRAYGVTNIVWEIIDDGVVLEVKPFFPADERREAAEAREELGRLCEKRPR